MNRIGLPILLIAILAGTVLGRATFDRRNDQGDTAAKGTRVRDFPDLRDQPLVRELPDFPTDGFPVNVSGNRISLGLAQSSVGANAPGMAVDYSYMDAQCWTKSHMVEFRTTPLIHFAYTDWPSVLGSRQFGYNVYDPTGGGSWPKGLGVGCEVQPVGQVGVAVMLDVDPRGLVVLAGVDYASGFLDNRFYFQSISMSCFWGAPSTIPTSQYNNGQFFDSTSFLFAPQIEIQEWATDTVLHVIASESEYNETTENRIETVVSYYRKVSTGASSTWQGPAVIDTAGFHWGGSLAGSRVSPQVAVAYTHYHEMAIIHDQRYDLEVFMRRSDSLGLSWSPPINVTDYPRTGSESSHAAFHETYAAFDSEDGLHVVWNAEPIVANPYEVPEVVWGDLSASLFHWTDRVPGSNAGGTISRIHNAEWGHEMVYEICGGPEAGSLYIGFFSLSECNGRLYTTFTQYLDPWGDWGEPQVDDCANTDPWKYRANGELALCVSNTLDGLLWDAARNLTNTYTPGCDSAGFGGECLSEMKASMSRYGMDSAAYGVELTWPGDELVDPSGGAYDGSHFLHLFYTEDHFPGTGYWDPPSGPLTLNPLKWMRLACVEPIPASEITVSLDYVGYPDYTPHGRTDTLAVSVLNEGNSVLNVTEIVATEMAGAYPNWLGVSDASLSVGAGAANASTFEIYLNNGPQVNNPGTIVLLSGEVYLLSNARNSDSMSILIDLVIADTVVGCRWDTLATLAPPRSIHQGDNTRLVVGSILDMGNNGTGMVNLDFVQDGNDCDPEASIYLFSGGPVLLRENVDGGDTSYVVTYALYQQDFVSEVSFKPVAGETTAGGFSGPSFHGFHSGRTVNRDSTVALERDYYAPTGGGDSTDFIVMCTRVYLIAGIDSQQITLAEAIDWDIPSYETARNVSGVLVDENIVYLQGTGPSNCQSYANRLGTCALLGFHSGQQFSDDSCFGVCEPHGSFANLFHQWWDSADASEVWDTLGAKSGLSSTGNPADQAQFLTYVHDWTLQAEDTLTIYSVVTSVRDGDTTALKGNLEAAFEWYRSNLRPECSSLCGCCVNITGNVDGDAGELVDIGDLTAVIAYLYIAPNPEPTCIGEANIDGDLGGLVDIGDLTALIAYLYIPPNPEPAACP